MAFSRRSAQQSKNPLNNTSHTALNLKTMAPECLKNYTTKQKCQADFLNFSIFQNNLTNQNIYKARKMSEKGSNNKRIK